MTKLSTDPAKILLSWYDKGHRNLPWRETSDPYRIWLSEVMCQQTTVATVIPYYMNFIERWPTVAHMARTDLDAILHAWQGLGYYARARNLLKCARMVIEDFDGCFPNAEKELRSLPGVGSYTAAAIAAIAFGRKAAPVDGNVIRVLTRIYAVKTPIPKARKEIENLASALVPKDRPGDFAQSLMELGAKVCTPRRPECTACPWQQSCAAYAQGNALSYPVKPPKKAKPTRYGVIFWTINGPGDVLLRRRPEKGLLGGMMEFPTTHWREQPWPEEEAIKQAPIMASWQVQPGIVKHTFTHFHLKLQVFKAHVPSKPNKGIWSTVENLSEHALPTVMKKVVGAITAHH